MKRYNEIVKLHLSEIIPYENNPRHNDEAVDKVANSIREFGYVTKIAVDEDNVIISGHTRRKALLKLHPDEDIEIEVVKVHDTPERIKALRIADNKVGELATWDDELLEKEIAEIMDLDMSEFGFSDEYLDNIVERENTGSNLDSEQESEEETIYTTAINTPQYIPRGIEAPLESLVDSSKTDTLLKEINESDIPEEIKAFLRLGAYRFLKFDYTMIAEYYATAPAEVQDLFEREALVIIDYDNALKEGFVKTSKTLTEILKPLREKGDEGIDDESE